MHWFHCPSLPPPLKAGGLSESVVDLDEAESHHAARVLRLRVGDAVTLFDGAGRLAQGVAASVGRRVAVRLSRVEDVPAPAPAIDVAAAVPKGSRADAMVEQLSQLGANRWIPLRTQRSIVDPRDSKLDRFARAAIESAKQCGRAHVMQISGTMTLAELWRLEHDLRLIASPGQQGGGDIAALLRQAQRVLILVGPEGGWAEEELNDAALAGCRPWSLGPHILRIETAAAAAAAVVRYLAMM